jgi:NAD(P)-dependent dehydrogenase (short-subunit alcohol dehydrogenase family)
MEEASMIDDVLGYDGKRAVVTGAASGMGAATAQVLVDLGAEVIALDVKPTDVPVKLAITADLRDKASIDAAVAEIGTPIDFVFSVAGLPGAPFSVLDTMLVNVVGARHLIESLVPAMPEGSAIVCVASTAGLGWQNDVAQLMPLVSSGGFDEAKAWCAANEEAIGDPYLFSKKVLNTWVAWRAATLLPQGIRLNCTNPGPTQTAMMPAFEAQHGAEMIDAFLGPSRRRSTAEEQAWPLVFLNSPRSSYIAGEALHTDAGFTGAMVTGQIDAQLPSDVAGAG